MNPDYKVINEIKITEQTKRYLIHRNKNKA